MLSIVKYSDLKVPACAFVEYLEKNLNEFVEECSSAAQNI